ncbi:hypothetical protein NXS19_007410 [Fusarium pseudograminearum]|nr:hypothetical protein NXS19_007410 [Fusarium pseudograminearum]
MAVGWLRINKATQPCHESYTGEVRWSAAEASHWDMLSYRQVHIVGTWKLAKEDMKDDERQCQSVYSVTNSAIERRLLGVS